MERLELLAAAQTRQRASHELAMMLVTSIAFGANKSEWDNKQNELINRTKTGL